MIMYAAHTLCVPYSAVSIVSQLRHPARAFFWILLWMMQTILGLHRSDQQTLFKIVPDDSIGVAASVFAGAKGSRALHAMTV